MTSSRFPVDPVFKTSDFKMFGNPGSIGNDPYLFEIYINPRRFKYCLVSPNETINNEALLLKIRRYLLAHENNEDLNNLVNTYFIGAMDKTIDVASEFKNQNIIHVTLEMVEQWYPKKLEDIYVVIIKHVLDRQKHLGQMNFFNSIPDDILFTEPTLNENEKRTYRKYIQDSLARDGYISLVNDGIHIDLFVLTAKGISLVQEKDSNQNRVAFIAIKFGGNTERIDAICQAINEAGFEPRIMNRMETNNWIMPEIFHQIENSRFVVADFSLPCDGAYYEAGYATALNKPVIHLFDKREETETNKLHFDIAQKSTIFYTNFDDLKTRLKSRIEATIK